MGFSENCSTYLVGRVEGIRMESRAYLDDCELPLHQKTLAFPTPRQCPKLQEEVRIRINICNHLFTIALQICGPVSL